MNRINLIGRLTKDVEIETNQAGTTKGKFTLAVNRPGVKEGMQEADFIPCTIWNKQAENLAKYQGKGSLIGVEGTLKVDNYENHDGEKRTFTYVQVLNVEYLSKPTKEEPIKEVKKQDPFEDFSNEMELSDLDLPF